MLVGEVAGGGHADGYVMVSAAAVGGDGVNGTAMRRTGGTRHGVSGAAMFVPGYANGLPPALGRSWCPHHRSGFNPKSSMSLYASTPV